MKVIERIHEKYVKGRRVRRLCANLEELIIPGSRVLDVGCGDGWLDSLIARGRQDVELSGIDVLVRENPLIPVAKFDGSVMPYADASFDMVMFVDVLHHTEDPMALLREGARVARKAILIKDHAAEGFGDVFTLRFMDKTHNARYGVALPFNYWSKRQWLDAFQALGLGIGVWRDKLGLYPWPASLLFDRSLHFIARLDLPGKESGT